MNDAGNARQQIVDKIKNSSNILVTVSTNPTVDALSAALGLTLMLNKLKKHATAVVSGEIPPAITFLDPEKTFEGSVDSLRDFIIALDKEKADHLRYKVDGDVVKIFITPYRTTITSEDLDFSQGDYNVELVLALGVKDKDHLDKALEAHGRILHDATVATVDVGGESSSLGGIDWKDDSASSLCEMLISLSEAIKQDDQTALDEQVATALLTGVVAATDRFSNNRTSPKVMTMAAQLMAAGANQQLIAAKLEDANEIRPKETLTERPARKDGTTSIAPDVSTKIDKKPPKQKPPQEKKADKKNDGSLVISHEHASDVDAVDHVAKQVSDYNATAASSVAEAAAEEYLETPIKSRATAPSEDEAQRAEQKLEEELSVVVPNMTEPSLGGTLNATTEQAAEDARKEAAADRNKTILNHDSGRIKASTPITEAPEFQSPFNAASVVDSSEPPSVDVFSQNVATSSEEPAPPPAPTISEQPAPEVAPPTPAPAPTLKDLDEMNRTPHSDARAAVDAALSANQAEQPAPEDPNSAQTPVDMPPLPDFSTLPPPPPPLPDFSQLSTPQSPDASAPEEPASTSPETNLPPVSDVQKSDDPGQFKIPGQP